MWGFGLFILCYPQRKNNMEKNYLNSLVYIVDDEFAIRDSLALLIESTGQAVRGFDSAESFLNSYSPECPGCLILDIKMPGMNGLELQQEMSNRAITIPIIFISGHAEISDSAKAFRAGAVDFLAKPFENNLLIERINEAIYKDIVIRKQQLEKYEIQKRLSRLTAREGEVLNFVVDSHSNKEIARILDVSHRTVDVHRARIMEKMEAENIAELLVMVMRA
jgi:FixJ family two-component response regulator